MEGRVCDDEFGDQPNRQTISSFFRHRPEDESISVLNFQNNTFTQAETIDAISKIIEDSFPNTKIVDLRGNYLGQKCWGALRNLISKHDVYVDIDRNLLLISSNCKKELPLFTLEQLKRLIWIPNSIEILQSPHWRELIGDEEKIEQVLRTHIYYYQLPDDLSLCTSVFQLILDAVQEPKSEDDEIEMSFEDDSMVSKDEIVSAKKQPSLPESKLSPPSCSELSDSQGREKVLSNYYFNN